MILLIWVTALYAKFFDIVEYATNFKTFVSVNNVLSYNTNGLYKCIVRAGSTYVNDHSSSVFCLITCYKCKL